MEDDINDAKIKAQQEAMAKRKSLEAKIQQLRERHQREILSLQVLGIVL